MRSASALRINFDKSTKEAYPASRGFFPAWLLVIMKSFASLVSRVVGYSYFEMGCRKICAGESRKVIWDIINILFLTL